jgi:hypothetical protein
LLGNIDDVNFWEKWTDYKNLSSLNGLEAPVFISIKSVMKLGAGGSCL